MALGWARGRLARPARVLCFPPALLPAATSWERSGRRCSLLLRAPRSPAGAPLAPAPQLLPPAPTPACGSSVVPPRSRVQRRLPGRPRPSAPGPGCTLAWPSTRASTRGRYLAQHPARHPARHPGVLCTEARSNPPCRRDLPPRSGLCRSESFPRDAGGSQGVCQVPPLPGALLPGSRPSFHLSLITAEQLAAARCGQRVILTLSERTSAFELCAGVKTLHPSPGKSTVTA